jgi:hypothetical protein
MALPELDKRIGRERLLLLHDFAFEKKIDLEYPSL